MLACPACYPRPTERDGGAVLYQRCFEVLDSRLLRDSVNVRFDLVMDAAGYDFDDTLFPGCYVSRREYAFQRVAQLSPAGCDVILFVADPNVVVERFRNCRCLQARPVVDYGHGIRLEFDRNLRRDTHGFGSVQGIVNQFLRGNQGPERLRSAELHRQFFFRVELALPASDELHAR